jgi:hypothetical protein
VSCGTRLRYSRETKGKPQLRQLLATSPLGDHWCR